LAVWEKEIVVRNSAINNVVIAFMVFVF